MPFLRQRHERPGQQEKQRRVEAVSLVFNHVSQHTG